MASRDISCRYDFDLYKLKNVAIRQAEANLVFDTTEYHWLDLNRFPQFQSKFQSLVHRR